MNVIHSLLVSTHGAELQSLVANGREYLWQGNPAFWGRRVPILFPIVGKLAEDTLRIDGDEYKMKQHGFARDAEFVPLQMNASFNPLAGWRINPNEGPIFMQMVQDGQIENYPYNFQLKVRYAIFGNTLEVNWEVLNRGEKTMHFQIGAHPAFLLPNYNASDTIHGYFRCYNEKGQVVLPTTSSHLENGLRHKEEPKMVPHKKGLIPIMNDIFKQDAILLDGGDVKSIGLLDCKGNEILQLSCPKAQVFGLWAPNKYGCPFVCIEPWCGAADSADFKGDISERDYNHSIEPNETFQFDYFVTIKQ